MPFFVAPADSLTGNLAGPGEQLSPGPGNVDYPQSSGPVGVTLQTAGGILLKQQPLNDGRLHAWIWSGVPTYLPRLNRFIGRLEGLVASTRIKRGLSPWVWLKDGETAQFRRLLSYNGTATSATTASLTDSSQTWNPGDIANGSGVVEIIQGTAKGERLSVLSNTVNQLTVSGFFSAAPVGSTYNVQYTSSQWFRVRVVSVTKKVRPKSGSVIFDELRLNFVLADTTWDDLG